MSYQFYLFLHVATAFLMMLSFGALIVRARLSPENRSLRIFGAVTSGVSLVVILVAGVGLWHKAGYPFMSWWIWVKIIGWLVLGGMLAVVNRFPRLSMAWFWIIFGIGAINALLGVYKGAF